MVEINPSYLQEKNKQKIRKSFLHSKFPAVILKDFFSKDFYAEIKKNVNSLSFKKEAAIIHHSYETAKLSLSSAELMEFISFVTKKKIEEASFTVYCLTWKDYIILHDKYLEKPEIDIIIDVTDNWNTEWGGVVTFTDGRGTIYLILPAGNSVAIVERKKEWQKYIQYVNHYGKEKKRMLLVATV